MQKERHTALSTAPLHAPSSLMPCQTEVVGVRLRAAAVATCFRAHAVLQDVYRCSLAALLALVLPAVAADQEVASDRSHVPLPTRSARRDQPGHGTVHDILHWPTVAPQVERVLVGRRRPHLPTVACRAPGLCDAHPRKHSIRLLEERHAASCYRCQIAFDSSSHAGLHSQAAAQARVRRLRRPRHGGFGDTYKRLQIRDCRSRNGTRRIHLQSLYRQQSRQRPRHDS